MSRARKWALIGVATGCVAGAIIYIAVAASNPSPVSTDARPTAGNGSVLGAAQLMVRAVDRADPLLNGRVFVVEGGEPREVANGDLSCERVYFAGGRGLCLATTENAINYEAEILDEDLEPVRTVRLAGLPSRARISRDGLYGATTVFVNGHAYLSGAGFSTVTTIFDMRTGEELGNLESFEVFMDGNRIDSSDFNFWGVTFAEDPNRFYATLRTGDHYYLVAGDLRRRRMRVLRDGVECPSLSPDGTRIAFKSRIGDQNRWRLKVLDLADMTAHPVAEKRSIDDQPEWLDDSTLVYSDGLDVYTVSADGGGEPRLVVKNASSPVSLVQDDGPSVKPGSKP